MHKERSEIEKIIGRFKNALENHGVKVDKIILFGSHAKGTANKFSDIDLVVISPDFAKMNFQRRCEILGKAIAHVMEPIEPLAYTPEEFRNISVSNIAGMIMEDKSEYVVI
ncbi:MAG: nucleotidyltransferase domain-containing protein [Bacillota bacterium]